MTHGVSYFNWRHGKPRWEPGPALRKRGAKGRDLKDVSGRWFSLAPALDAAQALNDQFGVKAKPPPVPDEPVHTRQGYVYFLVHRDTVKIGFTVSVTSRLGSLTTALAAGFKLFCAVPGSRKDEARLHYMFRSLRLNGEWFQNTWAMRRFISNATAANGIRWDRPWANVKVPERKSDNPTSDADKASEQPSEMPVCSTPILRRKNIKINDMKNGGR